MNQAKPVQVIAVSGGKGGVGKTNISVNLAVALAEIGKQVTVLDADLGLANIDVVLGLHPEYDLSHVLSGVKTLDEIIVRGPEGIQLIPGASGIQRMAELGHAEHAGIIQAFSELGSDLDTLIVDTAAGISDTVISFTRASQEVLIVVCDEPASITDAYAIIKLLNKEYGRTRFRVVANMVNTPQEGRDLYNKMCAVTDRYLDVMLSYFGAVPFDDHLKKAIKSQRPVVTAYPRSRVAQAFKNLARKVDTWPKPQGANGQMQFFVERLVEYSSGFGGF